MEWRSWEHNGSPQYALMDGDVEWVRIFRHRPVEVRTQVWIYTLLNPADIDDCMEGEEPTAALAAYEAMHRLDEWRKSLQKPQH